MGRWTLRWKERKISPIFEVHQADLKRFAEIGLGRVDGILKGWRAFINEADNWAKSCLATISLTVSRSHSSQLTEYSHFRKDLQNTSLRAFQSLKSNHMSKLSMKGVAIGDMKLRVA